MKIAAMVLALAGLMGMALAAGAGAGEPKLPGKGEASKSYQIANKKFKDLLRPKDANGADGVPIVLYSAQLWKCMTWKTTCVSEGAFTLQNHYTGKTFTLAADGKQVKQVAMPKEGDAPQWKLMRLEDGSYRITDPKSGEALTAQKGEKDDEAKVVIQPWADKDEQKWQLEEIDPAKLTM